MRVRTERGMLLQRRLKEGQPYGHHVALGGFWALCTPFCCLFLHPLFFCVCVYTLLIYPPHRPGVAVEIVVLLWKHLPKSKVKVLGSRPGRAAKTARTSSVCSVRLLVLLCFHSTQTAAWGKLCPFSVEPWPDQTADWMPTNAVALHGCRPMLR